MFVLLLCFAMGCGQSEQVICLTVENGSTNDLNSIELHWASPSINVGQIRAGISSSMIGLPWMECQTGVVVFVNKTTGRSHEIKIPLEKATSALKKGGANQLIIRIVDDEKAEVSTQRLSG